MSNRTLIEINHDFCGAIGESAAAALRRYLKSASRETAAELEYYGIRVLGMRHHSGNFVLDGEPDGFPVQHLTRQKG